MSNTMISEINWLELNTALSRPFDPGDIKYRAGAVSRDKSKAQAFAYVDPRCYEDRLNQLVPGAWQVEFVPWGANRIICRLTIHGVTRSSTGESQESSNGPSGTTAEAQAFKRTCAKFGLGRHLYSLEPRWVPYDAGTKRLEAPKLETSRSTAERPTRSDPKASSIGQTRAANLSRLLLSLGVRRIEQLAFARSILHRSVRDLAQLNERDAARVWKAASETPSRSVKMQS